MLQLTNVKKKEKKLTRWVFQRETKVPHGIQENHTRSVSYVRAASQVWIIDVVSEVEAQLNTLGSKRAENVFPDGSRQHRQSI